MVTLVMLKLALFLALVVSDFQSLLAEKKFDAIERLRTISYEKGFISKFCVKNLQSKAEKFFKIKTLSEPNYSEASVYDLY